MSSDAARQLLELAQRKAGHREVSRLDIDELRGAAASLVDAHGRVTPELQEALYTLESTLRPRFDRSAAAAFQSWVAQVGAKMRGRIAMPEEETPFWQLQPNPLAGFRSTPSLPEEVDLLIIGAGLTGASAAYHATALARAGQRVAVIDMADPASQASGRNGGNFELIPENFLGPYEGLVRERYKFLEAVYPGAATRQTLPEQAERQARLVLGFGHPQRERASPGSSPRSRSTATTRPTAGCASRRPSRKRKRCEARWRSSGTKSSWCTGAPRRSSRSWGCAPTSEAGARPGAATTTRASSSAACSRRRSSAGVGLYTRVRVDSVVTGAGPEPIVCTSEGDIRARRVIVATNAFTSHLFPELEQIECYQSQILNLEHVEDRLKGMTVTEKKGDLYYNFPGATRYVDAQGVRRGMLHVGGGLDRPAPPPEDLQRSIAVLGLVKAGTDRRFPDTRGQPPSRVWTGPDGLHAGPRAGDGLLPRGSRSEEPHRGGGLQRLRRQLLRRGRVHRRRAGSRRAGRSRRCQRTSSLHGVSSSRTRCSRSRLANKPGSEKGVHTLSLRERDGVRVARSPDASAPARQSALTWRTETLTPALSRRERVFAALRRTTSS